MTATDTDLNALLERVKAAPVKENLIAAKALIDTPEKFASLSAIDAIRQVVVSHEGDDVDAAFAALAPPPTIERKSWFKDVKPRPPGSEFGAVMRMFDRAIEAQP